MVLVKSVPVTSSRRFLVSNKVEVSKKPAWRSLVSGRHFSKGRNCYGRITLRHRGGGHKRLWRAVDADGEKAYILAPEGLRVGDSVVSLDKAVSNYRIGMSFPLSCIPLGLKIHAVEMVPGKGAALARSAGASLEIVGFDKGYASLKMPSGEIRLVDECCRATIGRVGNADHQNAVMGKAGRARWKGRRPHVRGCAMNPIDHPMGGGETGGGKHPVSPWGQLAKGYITRKRTNASDRFILVRRNGKKVKRG